MPTVHLPDRILIRLDGPDAEHFLQNIVTTDLDQLAAGEAKPGALLTPQGKVLFDFLVSRDGDTAYLLECRTDIADDFLRRLMMYRMRAKVEIAKPDQLVVLASWQADSSGSENDSTAGAGLRDLRFPAELGVFRVYAARQRAPNIEAYHHCELRTGLSKRQRLRRAFPRHPIDLSGGVKPGGCCRQESYRAGIGHRAPAHHLVGQEPCPRAGRSSPSTAAPSARSAAWPARTALRSCASTA